MKPTALLLLAGIAICMLAILLLPKPNRGATKKEIVERGGVTEMQKHDSVVGQGDEALPGKRLTVQYTGWLYDQNAPDLKGPKFDSSVGRAAFKFSLGGGEVIAGWDQGIVGMQVGGKRRLIIPPQLAYGMRGSPPTIPPNASLVFDVELEAID
jgi:FKBP-type peptidyl-prolyl cis-trans isomerase FkpA